MGKDKEKPGFELQSRIQYQELALVPAYWVKQADELIEASKKLEPNIKKYWLTVLKYFDSSKRTYNPPPDFKPKPLLQNVYFMLVAYAIENYFKAILVRRFETTWKDEIFRTGKLPRALNNHNLLELAKRTNHTLSDIDSSLLARLARNSRWQGRYPVPVDADELNSMTNDRGKRLFVAFFAPADISNLNRLTRRIRKSSTELLSPDEQRYLGVGRR